MKKKFLTFRTLGLCVLIAAMLLSIIACGSDTPNTSDSINSNAGNVSESSGTNDSVVSDSDSTADANSDASTTTASGDSATGNSNDSSSVKTSGNNKTNSTTATTKKQTVQSVSSKDFIKSMPSKLRGTTIKYFYWWDPTKQMEADAIAAFTKETGIKVQPVVGNYSSFQTELAAKISAGDSPDIVRLLSNAMYQVSSLQPITNSGYDFKDPVWNQQLMKDYTYNGKIYATNLRNDTTAILDPWLLYYNTKTIRTYDLEDPYTIWSKDPSKWTWKKLWELVDTFMTEGGNREDMGGVTLLNAYNRVFGGFYYKYDSAAGKWVNTLTAKATVDSWVDRVEKWAKRWLTETPGYAGLERGKLLFLGHGPYACRVNDTNFETMKKAGTLGVVPLPSDSPNYPLYEYTAFGIPQGAKNAAAVPYYLRYVLDRSNYDSSRVYESDKMRKVVEYAVGRTNHVFDENEVYELRTALLGGTPDQVKATLDSWNGVIQEKVDQENEKITYMSN